MGGEFEALSNVLHFSTEEDSTAQQPLSAQAKEEDLAAVPKEETINCTNSTAVKAAPAPAASGSGVLPAAMSKASASKSAARLKREVVSQPSSKAVKHEKIPPASSVAQIQPEDSTADELSDYEDEDCLDEMCDNFSQMSLAKYSSSQAQGSKRLCSCCFFKRFGVGLISGVPVSKNYLKIRERLQKQVLHTNKIRDAKQQVVEDHKKMQQQQQQQQQQPQSPKQQPQQLPASYQQALDFQVQKSQSHPNAARSQQLQQQQQQVSVKESPTMATKSNLGTKDVDELLDFIEGNQKNVNVKKRAKKERQKQLRLEELRKYEEEGRLKKEANKQEGKRQDEELLKAERPTLKKQKKKAARRAKKAAAKGLPPPEPFDPVAVEKKFQENGQPATAQKRAQRQNINDLEDLKMQQMCELKELQIRHQEQLLEKQKKLLSHNGSKPSSMHTSTTSATRAIEQARKAAAASKEPAQGHAMLPPQRACSLDPPSMAPTSPLAARAMGMGAVATGMQKPAGYTITMNGQPNTEKQSVQSNASTKPTVNITMKENRKDKLLYTFVNGQLQKVDVEAGKLSNKLQQQQQSQAQQSNLEDRGCSHAAEVAQQTRRAPLPNVASKVSGASLKTNEEEEEEGWLLVTGKKAKNKKKNKDYKDGAQAASVRPAPAPANASMAFSPPAQSQLSVLGTEIPNAAASTGNSLKKRPQLLMRNINGKVIITPVPEVNDVNADPWDLEWLSAAEQGH